MTNLFKNLAILNQYNDEDTIAIYEKVNTILYDETEDAVSIIIDLACDYDRAEKGEANTIRANLRKIAQSYWLEWKELIIWNELYGVLD